MIRYHVFIIYLLLYGRLEADLVRERTQVMNRYILYQNYPRCGLLQSGHYQTCELHDESDAKAIGERINSIKTNTYSSPNAGLSSPTVDQR